MGAEAAEEPGGCSAPLQDTAALHLQGGRGERPLGRSAAMHRFRTTVARLRPLTAAQTAKSRPRPGPTGLGLRRPLNTSAAAEPFLNGTSSNYVEEMYYAWLENPRNVHKVSVKYCNDTPPCVEHKAFT